MIGTFGFGMIYNNNKNNNNNNIKNVIQLYNTYITLFIDTKAFIDLPHINITKCHHL